MPRNKRDEPIPDNPTSAYLAYYVDLFNVDRFISLVFDLSGKLDYVISETQRISSKFNYESLASGDGFDSGENTKEQTTGVTAVVRSYDRLIMELMICRHVDNYLCYVSQVLADIFRCRPETLRSNEQVRLDFVLSHESMEALVDEIAERQVNKLSYQGMGDLADYLTNKIGLEVFLNEENKLNVIRAIEARNLIVHGRGVINKIYQKKVRDCTDEIGSKLQLDADLGLAWAKSLHESAKSIDRQSRTKFGVKSAKPV